VIGLHFLGVYFGAEGRLLDLAIMICERIDFSDMHIVHISFFLAFRVRNTPSFFAAE
jgi:hypothetical protein